MPNEVHTPCIPDLCHRVHQDPPGDGSPAGYGLRFGKTVTTLTAIRDLMYDSFEVHRVLIVAPLRVARDTWPEELRKWDHLQRGGRVRDGTAAGSPETCGSIHREPGEPGVALQELPAGF